MPTMSSSDNNREKVLEEFRNAWKQEVTKKQTKGQAASSDTTVKEGTTSVEDSISELVEQTESVTLEKPPVTAMEHYILATDLERQGKLGKALESYRRATKLDPDIDFLYKQHYQLNILPKLQENRDKPEKEVKDAEFKHIVPLGKEYKAPSALREDPLAELIQQFLNDPELDYIPQLDYKPVSIAKLPSEIILKILRDLVLTSVSTIPYFALTCKKFFLFSRDPSLWQYASVRVFRAPSMTLEQSKRYQMEYVQNYGGHWMRMFIDRPRIRYDGIYISTCHYIRQGFSDNGWDKPVHIVTYYRYLRFFPNGTILKHMTTDEPAQVVKQLQVGFNRKQCFHGNFVLEKDDHIKIVMKDPTIKLETFSLSLNIKTTHRGRHNKLVWQDYSSRSPMLDRGEHQYDLKMFKSFFFSPVRSYKVDYSAEFEDNDGFLLE